MIPMVNMDPNLAYPDLGRARVSDPASRELRAYLRWEFGGRPEPLVIATLDARPRTVRSRFRAWAARALGRLLPPAPTAPPAGGIRPSPGVGRAEGLPDDPLASGVYLSAGGDPSVRYDAAGPLR